MSELVEQAAERLRKAVPIMVKRGIPVTPVNYALWYTYVANENPHFNQHIDDIVATYGTIPPAKAEGLFRDHVSPTGTQENALSKMKSGLERMVADLSRDLYSTLEGTQNFNSLLDECNRGLLAPSGSGSLEEVLGTVERLIKGANAMQQHTSRFESSLSTADEEIRRLRGELATLRKDALHDDLTGVFNRRAFDQELDQFIGQGNMGPSLHLGMLDIDHFKAFNDRFGHPVGDRVLQVVGAQLNEMAQVGVSVYRYGGEEFCLIFCGGTLAQAQEQADRLRHTIEQLVLKDNRSGERLATITVSIGLASHIYGQSSITLVERADAALYEAKNSGRNRVCIA